MGRKKSKPILTPAECPESESESETVPEAAHAQPELIIPDSIADVDNADEAEPISAYDGLAMEMNDDEELALEIDGAEELALEMNDDEELTLEMNGADILNDKSKPLFDDAELPFYMDLINQYNERIKLKNKDLHAAKEKRRKKVIEVVEIKDDVEQAHVYPAEHNSTDKVSHVDLQMYPNPGASLPECAPCGIPFKTVAAYKDHLLNVHVASLPYQCTVCEKYFKTKVILRQHARFHGPKLFECETCKEAFPFAVLLRRHELLHTKDKAFSCTFCDKSFTQSANLTRHLVTHSENIGKPFECITCGRSFKYKHSLVRHCRNYSGHVC